MSENSGEITRLLHAVADGEDTAFERLIPIQHLISIPRSPVTNSLNEEPGS